MGIYDPGQVLAGLLIYDPFMDQTIDIPTALATSNSAQNFRAEFNADDIHPSQLTLGSMRHCFF